MQRLSLSVILRFYGLEYSLQHFSSAREAVVYHRPAGMTHGTVDRPFSTRQSFAPVGLDDLGDSFTESKGPLVKMFCGAARLIY